MGEGIHDFLIIQYNTGCQTVQSNLAQPIIQMHLIFRACKCWWLWHLGFGGNILSREPCQLFPKTNNFCFQSCNFIVSGGQGTIIVIDCSIEYLINIVLEGQSSTLIYILQYLYLYLILRHMLRADTISDKYILVLSTKVSKGNSGGKVGKS